MALDVAGFSATGHVALLARFEAARSPRSGNADQIHLWSDGDIAPAAGSMLGGSVAYAPSPGGIASLTFTANGSGYAVGNILTASGGTGSGATIRVDTVDGSGAILAHTVTAAGTGYVVGDNLTFTGGAGTGAAATVATLAPLINSLIRRVALAISAQFFILNRDGGVTQNFDTILSNEAVTLVRETNPITLVTLEADSNNTGGTGFAGWSVSGNGITSTEWDFFNAISAGDEFILAFHQGTASYTQPPPPAEALSVSARSGSPTASFNLGAVAPPTQTLSVSGRSGSPTASFNLSASALPAEMLSMQARSGSPTASFNLTAREPAITVALSMSARSGSGRASFNLRTAEPSVFFNLSQRASYRIPGTERADLLVFQWQNTELHTLMRGILSVFHDKLVIPLRALEYNLDDAQGWQLDVIGSRMDFPRPVVISLTEPVFGFEGSASHVVGFDQGYFRSVEDNLAPRVGVDDERYRRLLKMRAKVLVSKHTIPELDDAVQEVVDHAQYQDHGNLSLTLYIGTGLSTGDKALYLPWWPRPAGVGLTINDSVALPIT